MPQQLHAAVIASTQADRLVGHIARDSTAIEAGERVPEPVIEQERQARAQKPQSTKGAHASASVHDSQAAIALMAMTSQRVCYLYDLMD